MADSPESETEIYDHGVAEEFNYSAVEMLANLCLHERTLSESDAGPLFVARKYQRQRTSLAPGTDRQ